MKIEIAESLIYSHLKHNEGCRIVQTNWMTSGKWIVTETEKERAKVLFDKISRSEFFKDTFKNSSFDQLIKQAEIDVLGINTTENTIYGIDIAFHSAGLNYGSKYETAQIVLKKIFRTVFIMQTFFHENDKFHSYFITPKVNPATIKIINDLMIKAKEVISDDFINIEFISNDLFYSEIVDPLMKNTDDEHDTAELFSRAIKLIKLDKRLKEQRSMGGENKNIRAISNNARKVKGMKIGQFVQYSFREAHKLGLISETEIMNLQNPDYSKKIFNSRFEVLRNMNRGTKDSNGRNRYYTREIFCEQYRLTSQWIEPQWDSYLAWLKEIGYRINDKQTS